MAKQESKMSGASERNSKTILRCVAYWVFILVLTASFFVQYRPGVIHDLNQAQKGILFEETRWGATKNNLLVEPAPDAQSYGTIDGENEEEIMRNMTYRLFRDTSINEYDTYLFGILPIHKRLDSEERQQVYHLFEKITGNSMYEVDEDYFRMDLTHVMETRDFTEKQAMGHLKKEYYKELAYEFAPNRQVARYFDYEDFMPIRADLTYDEFKTLIGEVKDVIGRKTAAYEDFLSYGSIPLTYEEALARHEAFLYEDKVSAPYARQFFNSMILVSVLMTALAAAETARGGMLRRKRKTLIHKKGFLEVARLYLTLTIMIMIPILIFALAATVELAAGAGALGFTIGYFAFLWVSLIWMFPSVMVSAAAGLAAAGLYLRRKYPL